MKETMKKTARKRAATYEGLPLVDANEDVSLVITRNDSNQSKKKDPGNCAAALAGRREFKTEVRVYMSRMYVKDKSKKRWVRYLVPSSVSREITSFDRGAGFEPGEYVFKAPSPAQRLGYKPIGGNKARTGKGRKPHHQTANVRINARQDAL